MSELTETTRRRLKQVADLLRSGYSGKIELDCNQGGIRTVHLDYDLPDTNKKLDRSSD